MHGVLLGERGSYDVHVAPKTVCWSTPCGGSESLARPVCGVLGTRGRHSPSTRGAPAPADVRGERMPRVIYHCGILRGVVRWLSRTCWPFCRPQRTRWRLV